MTPKIEPNGIITFSQESFICYRQDGEIIAIEDQPNGHIVRYETSKCSRGDSLRILGADKVKAEPKK